MTVKYVHIRAIDVETEEILPHGGVTIAYTVSDIEGMRQIYVTWVKCRSDELFCYKTGRETAKERLKNSGPHEVLDLEHPISDLLTEWLSVDVWPDGPIRRDMGFPIDCWRDDKMRWVSTFEPSHSIVEFEPAFETDDFHAGYDCLNEVRP
jgi:hypothetical protein